MSLAGDEPRRVRPDSSLIAARPPRSDSRRRRRYPTGSDTVASDEWGGGIPEESYTPNQRIQYGKGLYGASVEWLRLTAALAQVERQQSSPRTVTAVSPEVKLAPPVLRKSTVVFDGIDFMEPPEEGAVVWRNSADEGGARGPLSRSAASLPPDGWGTLSGVSSINGTSRWDTVEADEYTTTLISPVPADVGASGSDTENGTAGALAQSAATGAQGDLVGAVPSDTSSMARLALRQWHTVAAEHRLSRMRNLTISSISTHMLLGKVFSALRIHALQQVAKRQRRSDLYDRLFLFRSRTAVTHLQRIFKAWRELVLSSQLQASVHRLDSTIVMTNYWKKWVSQVQLRMVLCAAADNFRMQRILRCWRSCVSGKRRRRLRRLKRFFQLWLEVVAQDTIDKANASSMGLDEFSAHDSAAILRGLGDSIGMIRFAVAVRSDMTDSDKN